MKRTTFSVFLVCIFFTISIGQDQDFSFEPKEYGAGNSIGLSLIGNGVIGFTMKFANEGKNQIDLTASLSNRVEGIQNGNDFEVVNVYYGVAFSGAYNFFMGSNYKRRKDKVIKNYLGLKALLVSRNSIETGFAINWHREAFRRNENKYSRGLDLGIQYLGVFGGEIIGPTGEIFNGGPNIYIRVDWNWFR